MRTLIMTVSALALAGTVAQAQVQGEGPVWEAWNSSAGTHDPLDPFPHNNPTPPETIDPLKPGPLEIEMRMYKGCNDTGQCAYVDQVGAGNDININQSAAPGGSVADVIQIGDNNAASVEQRSGADSHYAVVTQQGDDNGAAIRQHSDIITGASYADIQQGGDGTSGVPNNTLANNNWASIDQGISAGGGDAASYGNKAKILQQGRAFSEANNNRAAIRQQGDVMLSLIDQDGDENLASILQTGTGGQANNSDPEDNEARITQVGLRNTAATVQDGQRHKSSIDQVGNFNTASTEQLGFDNTAVVKQGGDDNTSVIGQDGVNNMASSTQDGNLNFSSIWQSGTDNMAASFQTGDSNYSAIEQFGNLNAASVVQNGFDFADVQQNGSGNVAAVWQQ